MLFCGYMKQMRWEKVREWWNGIPVRERLIQVGLLIVGLGMIIYALDQWDDGPEIYFERVAAGKGLKLHHYVDAGLLMGLLIAGGIVTGVGATARWWLGGSGKRLESTEVAEKSSEGLRIWWVLVLMMILLTAAIIRYPRLNLSVYGDEEYGLRRFTHGEFMSPELGKEEIPEFQPVTWSMTLWSNPIGNNHVLYSVVGRLFLDFWKWGSGEGETGYRDWVYRMPAFVAGLASLVLIAWIFGRQGRWWSGLIAATWLTLHPWHIRYSTEGRGYGFVFFWILLGWICLDRAAKGGHWKWYFAFAGSQLGLLLSFAGGIYLAFLQSVAALIWLAWKKDWLGWKRFVVTNALGAAVFIQIKIPWFLQQMEYMAKDRAKGPLGGDWLANVWGCLTTGMMWVTDHPESPKHITIQKMAEDGLPVQWWALIFIPLLLIAGGIRLWCWGGNWRVVLLSIVGCGPLAYLHAISSGHFLYVWYMIVVLVGMAVLIGAGVGGLGDRKGAGFGILGVVLIGICALTVSARQIQVVRANSKESFKAVVELARGEIDPSGKILSRAITATYLSEAGFYDPQAFTIWTAEDVYTLMRESQRTGKPLRISFGHLQIAEERLSEMTAVVTDPRYFQLLGTFDGLEEQQFTHFVYDYTGEDPPEGSGKGLGLD